MSETPKTVARWTGGVSPHERGGFVAYGDYLTLQQALATVTAERDKLQSEVKELNRLLKNKTAEAESMTFNFKVTNQAYVERDKKVRELTAERSAHEATKAERDTAIAGLNRNALALVDAAEQTRNALAELEACRADSERLQKQIDAITEMNHGQFLQLEFLRKVYEAAHELYCESEEYDFDDGLGKGAPQQYWDALADAFEPETDAIKDEIDAAMKEPSDV